MFPFGVGVVFIFFPFCVGGVVFEKDFWVNFVFDELVVVILVVVVVVVRWIRVSLRYSNCFAIDVTVYFEVFRL
jgi:hypothetical protein